MAFGQLGDDIRQFSDQFALLRLHQIQRRAHMQHAGVGVAIHAVFKLELVEHATKVGHISGQILRRHGGVFDECDPFFIVGQLAEQTHRALAQIPQRGNARRIGFGGEMHDVEIRAAVGQQRIDSLLI